MPPLDSNRGSNNPPRDYRRKYEGEPLNSNGPRKHSGSSYIERDNHGYHRGSGSNGYYSSKKDFRPSSNGSSQGYSGYNNGYYGSYNNRYREPLPERRPIGEPYKPRSNDRIPKDSRYRQQPMVRDYRDSRPYWNNRVGSSERISSSVPSSSRYYNDDGGYGPSKKPQSSYAERNNRSSDGPSYGPYSSKLNTLNKNQESPLSSEASTPRVSTRPSFANAPELEAREQSKAPRKDEVRDEIKEEQEQKVAEKLPLEKIRSIAHVEEISSDIKPVEEPVNINEKTTLENPTIDEVKLEVNQDTKQDTSQQIGSNHKEDKVTKSTEQSHQETPLNPQASTQVTNNTTIETEVHQHKYDTKSSESETNINTDNTNINKEAKTEAELPYRTPKIEGCIFPMNRLEDRLWGLQTRPKTQVLENQWYLNNKKIESFTEYPFYVDNLLLHINVLSPKIGRFLQTQDKSILQRRARLTDEFFSRSKQWRQRQYKMDEQLNKLHFKEAASPVPREEEPDASKELKTSRRSRHGDFVGTEAEFQEILESLEREKEKDPLYVAQKGAAVIPKMILNPIERETLRFINTNNLVTDKDGWAQRIKTDPIDTFTEKEHEMFVEAYIHHPKKFGRISAALGGLRTPEECVLHYYRTKKTKTNFKQVLASRKKGRGKGARRTKVVLEKKAKPSIEDTDVKQTPEPMKRKRGSSTTSLNGAEVKKPRGNRTQETATTSEELQRKKPHLSSYWSVQEVKLFKGLLEEHGENWEKISSIMKSKSSTMVKNFYQKKIREDSKKDDEGRTVNDSLEGIEDMKTPDEQVEVTPKNETPSYELPHISTFYTSNLDQKKQVQEPEETIAHSKLPSIMNLLNN